MLRKEILNGELTDEHTHQLKVPRIPELAFISLSYPIPLYMSSLSVPVVGSTSSLMMGMAHSIQGSFGQTPLH